MSMRPGWGFKYIGTCLVQERSFFGGEESAGLTIKDHVPEKDGIHCLPACGRDGGAGKRSLKELLKRLFKRSGRS